MLIIHLSLVSPVRSCYMLIGRVNVAIDAVGIVLMIILRMMTFCHSNSQPVTSQIISSSCNLASCMRHDMRADELPARVSEIRSRPAVWQLRPKLPLSLSRLSLHGCTRLKIHDMHISSSTTSA